MSFAVAILIGIMVTSIVMLVFYKQLFSSTAVRRRVREITSAAPAALLGKGVEAEALRREMLAFRLEEVARREKSRRTIPLDLMLDQAGIRLSAKQYISTSFLFGVIIFILTWSMIDEFLIAAIIGTILGYYIPNSIVKKMRKWRMNALVRQLPDAIEAMVRSMRAGVHISEASRIIAKEATEPLRSEFRAVVDEQRLGSSFADAIERFSMRVPVEEARFLALAVSIQSEEGGGLAETLLSLARTMRERNKLAQKNRAIMAESRTSAVLLTALPFLALLMNYMFDAEKTSLLWTTSAGQIILAGCLGWLAIGYLVMRRIQNIKA